MNDCASSECACAVDCASDRDDTKSAADAIANRYYHCYCLRSLDPKHPYKNYVGFTTNPHRRIRQHNGITKGGAWKTRRYGRPWEFVVIVGGFPTHKMALQFEWAWQHPDKSLIVRGSIGDEQAKKLKRKRGTQGQMSILKTLLERCPDLYDRNDLSLHFLKDECKQIYEKKAAAMPPLLIASAATADNNKDETTLIVPPPPTASVKILSSLDEMPFYATRNKKYKRKKKNLLTNEFSSVRVGEEEDNPDQDCQKRMIAASSKEKDGNSIGELYRRCCDFDLLVTSSSEEDNDEVFYVRQKKNATAVHSHYINGTDNVACMSSSTSSGKNEDDDNNISFLAFSVKDMNLSLRDNNLEDQSLDSFSSEESLQQGEEIKHQVDREDDDFSVWSKGGKAASFLTGKNGLQTKIKSKNLTGPGRPITKIISVDDDNYSTDHDTGGLPDDTITFNLQKMNNYTGSVGDDEGVSEDSSMHLMESFNFNEKITKNHAKSENDRCSVYGIGSSDDSSMDLMTSSAVIDKKTIASVVWNHPKMKIDRIMTDGDSFSGNISMDYLASPIHDNIIAKTAARNGPLGVRSQLPRKTGVNCANCANSSTSRCDKSENNDNILCIDLDNDDDSSVDDFLTYARPSKMSNPSMESVISPSTGRATKTKRVSIVDLCSR